MTAATDEWAPVASVPPDVSLFLANSRAVHPRETIGLSVVGESPVSLLFVEMGPRLYVLPTNPPGAWFAAAAREGRVATTFPDGSSRSSAAHVRSGPALLSRLQGLFERKYGEPVWRSYFANTRSALEIALDEPVGPRDPSARIRGEFDAAAEGYDTRLAQNPVDRYLKSRVTELACPALEALDPVLEIGAGTGYHTMELLAAGHRVTVIDISSAMLERLRERVVGAGWGDRLETRCGPASDLEGLTAGDAEGTYGGVFSAFGALDLEAHLDGFARTLGRIVRPGGRFVLTSLNRPGWSPFLWDLALARPAAAGARLGPDIPPGGVRYPLTLYPRSPLDWDRLLTPRFVRLRRAGVSVLAPPFDAGRPLRFFGAQGAARLRRLDAWLTERRSAWAASEWLFLTYRREGATSAPVPPIAERLLPTMIEARGR